MNGIFRLNATGPRSLLAIGLVLILFVLIIPLLFLGIAGAAFSRLGFSWIEAVAVLLLMVAGSLVNLPLTTIRRPANRSGAGAATVFDAFTGEPVQEGQPGTALTVNAGGAVIPFVVSVYLLSVTPVVPGGSLLIPLAVTFGIVALATALFTTGYPGAGTRAPLFLPALTGLACGLVLAGGTGLPAAVTAFAGGTMGTVSGSGCAALIKGVRHGIPTVSIGGAGTFWSVLACVLLSALIA